MTPLVAAHAALCMLMILALRWSRRWLYLYSVLVWPGTVAHELMHLIAGWLFLARPKSMRVWPRKHPQGGLVLGHVEFERLQWWNSVPVSLAPLALVPLAAALFVVSLGWGWLAWTSLLLKLAVAQLMVSTWPSGSDWRHAATGAAVVGIFLGGVWWLAVQLEYLPSW